MEIITEFNVGDDVFFLFQNQIQWAKIETINIQRSCEYSNYVRYTLNENPCGSQYTKMFFEHELFKTKEDLINNM